MFLYIVNNLLIAIFFLITFTYPICILYIARVTYLLTYLLTSWIPKKDKNKNVQYIMMFYKEIKNGPEKSLFQFSSVAQLCLTLCNPMDCSKPGFPVHHQPPEFTQTRIHWVSDAIQPSHPLSSPSPSASIRVFSNESVLHISWPKIGSFSFSISPSNEYSGPISFRIDWLDLLVVQGTLKSLLQHFGSKASILQYSAFFIVQLAHQYMTPGKTIALTRPLSAK